MLSHKILRNHRRMVGRGIYQVKTEFVRYSLNVIFGLSPITARTNNDFTPILYMLGNFFVLSTPRISSAIKPNKHILVFCLTTYVMPRYFKIRISGFLCLRSNQRIELSNAWCLTGLAGPLDTNNSSFHKNSPNPQLRQII